MMRKERIPLYFWAVAWALVWASSMPGYGQGTDASMTGVIRGKDGEPLPGATVLVRNESTGFQSGTVTNLDGLVSFAQRVEHRVAALLFHQLSH